MDRSIKNRQDVTARRVGGRKILILSAAGVSLAVDIAVVIMLGIAGITAASYLVCPIILIVADVLFLLFAVFSNFRFKYALGGAAVFAAAEAILTIIMLASHSGGERAMTGAALGLWTVAHIASAASFVVLAIDGASMGKTFGRIATVIAAVVGALLIGYAVFAIAFGVFGQGTSARTLTFTADGDDGYTVSGVVEGRGNAIIIPRTFDGKPVTSVDCAVFCEAGITEIYIDADDAPELKNVEALDRFGRTPVRVYKDNVNAVRKEYFALAHQYRREGLARFCSAIEPTGLDKNEVFITYEYDLDDLDAVGGKALPVWIGKKGDVFDLSDLAEIDGSLDYVLHSDYTSDEDMHWCYTHERGMLDVSNFGITLNNKQIVSSVSRATPEFLNVYAVTIGEDNDTKYELPDDFKKTVIGGETLDHRYTTIKTANLLTLSAPTRDGFGLRWTRSAGMGNTPIDSLAEELANASRTLTIYPEWTLAAPVITRIDVAYTGENAAIYGDELTLAPVLDESTTAGFEVSYDWTKPSAANVQVSADDGSLYIDVVKMDCAGNYTITVTKSAEFTSLTATATRTEAVRVDKRPLRFVWVPFSDPYYTGTPKEIRCAYNGDDKVAGDSITFGRSITSVTNAGSYSARVTLTGDCAYKYVIAAGTGSHSYTVLPRRLRLCWAETIEYTYDGNTHTPEFTFEPNYGPIEGEDVQATTLGGGKDAGTYNATVTVRNPNYTIESGSVKRFTVKKREIGDVTFATPSGGFTYNGTVQMPSVASVGNCVDGEQASVIRLVSDNLVKSGDCIHAGDYVLTVALPDDCNYSVPSTPRTVEFDIAKKDITVSVGRIEATYGDPYTYSCTADGLADGDSVSSALAVTYFINGVEVHSGERRDFGTYAVTATATGRDYNVTAVTDGTLTVNKRKLIIAAFDANKVYDGKPYSGFQGSIGGRGFASGDSYNEVLASVDYSCDGVNASDTPYTITASATLTTGKGKNYELEFKNGELTITKAALTVKINDKTHVYDGNVPTGFTVSAVSGLVNGETVETAGLGISYVIPNDPNVGTYDVYGTGTSTNYKVTVRKGSLRIDPRPITVEWNDDSVFTYDGSAHAPTVSGITNVVAGKEPKITVTGAQTDAGVNYVARATLDRNNDRYGGNYVIVSGETQTFTINKAVATFMWSGKTEYAVGENIDVSATCDIDGLSFDYEFFDESGNAISGIPTAAGRYTVRVSVDDGNYAVAGGEFGFTISAGDENGGQSL